MKILRKILGYFRPKPKPTPLDSLLNAGEEVWGELEAQFVVEVQKEERRQAMERHEEGRAWQDYARKQDEAFSSR